MDQLFHLQLWKVLNQGLGKEVTWHKHKQGRSTFDLTLLLPIRKSCLNTAGLAQQGMYAKFAAACSKHTQNICILLPFLFT